MKNAVKTIGAIIVLAVTAILTYVLIGFLFEILWLLTVKYKFVKIIVRFCLWALLLKRMGWLDFPKIEESEGEQ